MSLAERASRRRPPADQDLKRDVGAGLAPVAGCIRSSFRDRSAVLGHHGALRFLSNEEVIRRAGRMRRVLDPPRPHDSQWTPPRLFSRDDKRFLALIECRRDLEEAQRAIERFQSQWFVQDPPDRSGARESAANLRDVAQALKNSALNLLYLTSPNQDGP